MRGKIVLAFFVFTIVAMYAAFRFRTKVEIETQQARRVPVPNEVAPAASTVPARAPDGAANESPAEAPVVAPTDPKFQTWLESEAKNLDSVKVDGDRKQSEIREIVRKITPAQSAQLRQTVIHPQAKAREKILSAYLLVEGGLSTRDDLREAITAPLREERGEPHSEAEINGVREKSLRIMMIDGLSAQAQSDKQARASLAKAIGESTDPYIKAYAQRRYDELPPLKSEF